MQGIVIQGPTNYCKEIVECYKNIPNVVWSTWEDEPKENIAYIKTSQINVVLNKKPKYSGYLNVNMQTVSTIGGVKYLKSKGITEILKTRGDILISNLNKFLEILKNKPLALLAIAKEGARTDLYYDLVYSHTSHDYPVDLVTYGETENIFNMFNFLIEEDLAVPPEALISYNFLNSKNIDFKLNYKHFIDNNIYFYLQDCLDNKIKLNWLKHNNDLVNMHKDKNIYDY